MTTRIEDNLDREDAALPERKVWTRPKLVRVIHKVAGSNFSGGPYGDSPFAYS